MKKIICILILLLVVAGCQKKTDKTENNDQEVSTSDDSIAYEQLESYFSQFECGDIINLENSHYLSNLAIPGKWKHSLIYLGSKEQVQAKIDTESQCYTKIIEKYETGQEIFVLDANSAGVKIRLFSAMANLDEDSYLKALVCFRLQKDNKFIKSFIETAMEYYDVPYDYEMNLGDDALYCSELLYYALLKNGIELTGFQNIIGHQVLTPTDLSDELENKKIAQKILILENGK